MRCADGHAGRSSVNYSAARQAAICIYFDKTVLCRNVAAFPAVNSRSIPPPLIPVLSTATVTCMHDCRGGGAPVVVAQCTEVVLRRSADLLDVLRSAACSVSERWGGVTNKGGRGEGV